MEYLIEMYNAGIKIALWSPGQIAFGKWYVQAEKTSSGITLKITAEKEELNEAIEELYSSWKKSIGSLPEHGLKQITLKPQIEEEIPF